jgi:hypothetical protein
MQTVRTGRGDCGTILWESKRAKDWSDAWVDKLREDQRHDEADLAVIVTGILPKGAERIDVRGGVWITDLARAPQLALVLREQLIALCQLRSSFVRESDLKGVLYEYVTGSTFIDHVKCIVESLTRMQDQLGDEGAAMERIWATRRQEVHRAVAHMSQMIGDLEGIDIALPVPSAMVLEPSRPASIPSLPLGG